MRNLGIITFIVGLLLLILNLTVIRIIGIIGLVIGLLMIIFPEQASAFTAKFSSSKKKESEEEE
jgi:drug/metabolite transporter (DMT)-like permease